MSELSRDEVSEMLSRLYQKHASGGPTLWSDVVEEIRDTIFRGSLSVAAVREALTMLESPCMRGSVMDQAVTAFRELLNARPLRATPREVGLPSLVDLRRTVSGPALADLKTDPWLGRNEIWSILARLEERIGLLLVPPTSPHSRHEFEAVFEDLRERLATEFGKVPVVQPSAPVPMILSCPSCSARHIDKGEFATKVHHTHACQSCGMCWRPAVVPTVGVQYLPGFKDEA